MGIVDVKIKAYNGQPGQGISVFLFFIAFMLFRHLIVITRLLPVLAGIFMVIPEHKY